MQMIYSFINEEHAQNFYLCDQVDKNQFNIKKIDNLEQIKNFQPTLHLQHGDTSLIEEPIKVDAIMSLTLNDKLEITDEKVEFNIENILTGINLQSFEDAVEAAKVLAEHFHQDRVLFTNLLWKFLSHQLSTTDLKIIFTDVLEKKVKEEIKTIVQTKTCSGSTKEEIKLATDLESNVFSAYNIKNPSFSILGQREETKEFFACFHLESVNFIVHFKELNEFNRLQKGLLKLMADLIDTFAADRRIKVKKRKQESKPKVETATTTSVPANSTIH